MTAETRDRIRRAGRWALVLLVAAGVHAAWLLIPITDPAPNPPPRRLKATVLVERIPGGWSPTLFSLPSPTGFSGAMREESFRILPPLRSPLTLTETGRISLPVPEIQDPPDLPALSGQQAPLAGRVTASTPATPQPPLPVWDLTFPDAPADPDVRLSRLPGLSPQTPGMELRGEVAFDPGGRVTSLVVHPPLPQDPAVPEMIRVLRRMQQTPTESGSGPTRFHFRYVGAEEGR